MPRKPILFVPILLLLLLAACQQAEPAAEPGAAPTATALPEVEPTDMPPTEAPSTEPAATATPIPEGAGEYPAAAVRAREALAQRLDVELAQVEILSFQQQEWRNGCLGLARPGEMCTEALVPGWRVMLSAEGQTYEARTDRSGNVVRFTVAGREEPLPQEPPSAAISLQRGGDI